MISLFKVHMAESAPALVADVLRSGFVGQGEMVERFEAQLAEFTPHPPVSTNSCTSAIHAVLMHLGVGPGDEVVTTPLTCVATNAPILAVGARPVWADVDRDGNIDPGDVAHKVTRRTKAIIAVNWTGRPPDYRLLRNFGLPVIEDAAHGPVIGAREHGDFVCYSFGPIKHLTCGDGGAVATASEAAREDLRLLRWYGLDRRSTRDFRCAQNISRPGMKLHMTDINAAIGVANLSYLSGIVGSHITNAGRLHRALADVVDLPPWHLTSNYWVFPLLLSGPEEREAMRVHLHRRGVASSQVHSRNDRHRAYDFPSGPLPGLDRYDSRHLNIPCGWWLSESDLDQIVSAVRKYWS